MSTTCPGCGETAGIYFGPVGTTTFRMACTTCRIATPPVVRPLDEWKHIQSHVLAIKNARWGHDIVPRPGPGELSPDLMEAREHIDELLTAREAYLALEKVQKANRKYAWEHRTGPLRKRS